MKNQKQLELRKLDKRTEGIQREIASMVYNNYWMPNDTLKNILKAVNEIEDQLWPPKKDKKE